jgi:diketogulonate reductase-like aldo/keto reductase
LFATDYTRPQDLKSVTGLNLTLSFQEMSARMPSKPAFIYGTAWKKEATAGLVRTAVETGFKAIDTANQPKHYQEPLVGEALKSLLDGGVSRDSLFVQTKFTPINGQDHRVPYDPQAAFPIQVRQSFESSLRNLKTDYLDSYLLHGPYSYPGLGDEDWDVWHAIEQLYTSGERA